jgi:hypothetical protein
MTKVIKNRVISRQFYKAARARPASGRQNSRPASAVPAQKSACQHLQNRIKTAIFNYEAGGMIFKEDSL